ncbi:YkgJ family cysteine cluster protein [Stenotrophomonas sp. SY1]|uniref:YkgJ family cysteine cluster protein n=1 Tax=Stenotrophomonas sp. SY1 TaxID=477235 RepID=UPI001E36DCDB|nr:YkgJ family cysteine cluster protein [Stenotrophomonas sp. SY1]MCD9088138.1 YkgJ family cysteine cluster protein [Stenotrophomonas sp. SY1]
MNRVEREKKARITCAACDSLCCQLTVVLEERDTIPAHLTTRLPSGLHVMAKDEDGWCVALDGQQMRCRIYASRPIVCRSFVMGGPYCRAERDEHARQKDRTIALQLT